MKADVERTIEARLATAFADILPETSAKQLILKGAQDLVRAVWITKIYASLPKDKTTSLNTFSMRNLSSFWTKLLKNAMLECVL